MNRGGDGSSEVAGCVAFGRRPLHHGTFVGAPQRLRGAVMSSRFSALLTWPKSDLGGYVHGVGGGSAVSSCDFANRLSY